VSVKVRFASGYGSSSGKTFPITVRGCTEYECMFVNITRVGHAVRSN
jgi:hypothetical protein